MRCQKRLQEKLTAQLTDLIGPGRTRIPLISWNASAPLYSFQASGRVELRECNGWSPILARRNDRLPPASVYGRRGPIQLKIRGRFGSLRSVESCRFAYYPLPLEVSLTPCSRGGCFMFVSRFSNLRSEEIDVLIGVTPRQKVCSHPRFIACSSVSSRISVSSSVWWRVLLELGTSESRS